MRLADYGDTKVFSLLSPLGDGSFSNEQTQKRRARRNSVEGNERTSETDRTYNPVFCGGGWMAEMPSRKRLN